MKNIIYVILLTTVMSISSIHGQNNQFKTGISFKALFMDYQSQNGGDLSDFKSYHSGVELGLHRNLINNLNINIPFKIGIVQSHVGIKDFQKTVYGADFQLQYQFYKPSNRFNPYILVGIGAIMEDDGEFNAQTPAGIGLNIRLADHAYINLQSEYRKSFKDDRDNLHHGIGFLYLFGKKIEEIEVPEEVEVKNDSDGDGLIDDIDLCPQAPGPEELNGCPDTDGDTIADYEDECPEIAGSKDMNGCPDTDGDGISDIEDECPNMAGELERNGCPDNDTDNDGVDNDVDQCPDEAGPVNNNGCPILDTDGDGVADDQDRCPNSKGSPDTNGCPDSDNDGIADFEDKCPDKSGPGVFEGCPDTDGDGIDDSRDECPNSAGTVDRNGCPEIDAADREVLDLAMRAVQFDTGRSTLKSESNQILNQIADIMFKYPDFKLTISGHTDNTGAARANLILSERRAQACLDYLISRGVSASKMTYEGFGETKPIAGNNSLSGRALNRRVEFHLEPGN